MLAAGFGPQHILVIVEALVVECFGIQHVEHVLLVVLGVETLFFQEGFLIVVGLLTLAVEKLRVFAGCHGQGHRVQVREFKLDLVWVKV